MSDAFQQAQDLIQAALQGSAAVSTPAAPPEPAALEAELPTPADLIELYFASEEPLERDAVFEQLAQQRDTLVEDFFLAMLTHDADAFLRMRAAATLLTWQSSPSEALPMAPQQATQTRLETIAAAWACLVQELNAAAHAADLEHFSYAMQSLIEQRASAAYEPLASLWQHPTLNTAVRRSAMQGMEWADSTRALAAFHAYLQSYPAPLQLTSSSATPALERLWESNLEACMLSFARHAYMPALPVLRQLQASLAKATWHSRRAQHDLALLLRSGIALLAAPQP